MKRLDLELVGQMVTVEWGPGGVSSTVVGRLATVSEGDGVAVATVIDRDSRCHVIKVAEIRRLVGARTEVTS